MSQSICRDFSAASLFYQHTPIDKKAVILFDDLINPNSECRDAYILFLYLRSIGVNAYYIVLRDNSLPASLIKVGFLQPNIIVVKNLAAFFQDYGFILHQAWLVISSYKLPRKYAMTIKDNPAMAFVYLGHGEFFFTDDNMYYSNFFPYDFMVGCCTNAINSALRMRTFSYKAIIQTALPRYDVPPRAPAGGPARILMHFNRGGLLRLAPLVKFAYRLRKFLRTGKRTQHIRLSLCPNDKIMRSKIAISLCKIFFRNIDLVAPCELSGAAAANMLITDISHIAMDFAYADKPIIFFDLYKDIERDCFYNFARSECECFSLISKYAAKDFVLEEKYKKINAYQINRGGENCRAIWDFIQGLAIKENNFSRLEKKLDYLNWRMTALTADGNGLNGLNAKLNYLSVPEQYHKFFYALSPGDIVFDCGANKGDFTEICRHMNAEVYAFEPHPGIYGFLANRFHNQPTIKAYNAAVSDFNGEADFYINSDDDDFFNNSSNIEGFLNNAKSGYKVRVIDLADFIKKEIIYAGKKIKILKLDIEGSELKVIKKLLRYGIDKHCGAILCEVHYRDEVMPQIQALIKAYGADNIYLDWQ